MAKLIILSVVSLIAAYGVYRWSTADENSREQDSSGMPVGDDAEWKEESDFTPVEPAGTSGNAAPSPVGAPVSLQPQTGSFFQFLVPAGWRVQEEGQYAVVLVAPDNSALTLMTGNSGLSADHNPAQFVHERLSRMQLGNLQVDPPRQARPIAGCASAWEFTYSYSVNGEPCRGVAKCSIAPTYAMCTMVMTCAASKESQWRSYEPWLPQVADQVAALNGAAFGARGVLQQNLRNSIAIGEQARQNREHSAQTWNAVNNERAESQDRNNSQFRENLGNVQTYTNPYESRNVELPTTYSHYWVNRQGKIVGTNDPRGDPNTGSTGEWSRMNPSRP